MEFCFPIPSNGCFKHYPTPAPDRTCTPSRPVRGNEKAKTLPKLNVSDITPTGTRKSKYPSSQCQNNWSYEPIGDYRKPSVMPTYTPSSFSVDEKFEMLMFAFQEVDKSIVVDVLIAKNYDLAGAAEVLSAFQVELLQLTEGFQFVQSSETCEPALDKQQETEDWIVVADEWQAIDMKGQTIPTYSEIAQSHPSEKSTSRVQPKKTSIPASSSGIKFKNGSSTTSMSDVDEYSAIKAQGQTRLHRLKKDKREQKVQRDRKRAAKHPMSSK